ncbi:MAG: polysaccharide biosynthesis protein, partial [Streptococcaceae bacterium]|nr:polysaccharide biosynthesis protein [Streptococcaceae bacterium]
MENKKRFLILLLLDISIILFSIFLSNNLFVWVPTVIITYSVAGIFGLYYWMGSEIFGIYRKAWEYASVHEITAIAKTVTFAFLGTLLTHWFIFQTTLNRILIVAYLLQLILITGSRLIWRVKREYVVKNEQTSKKTLVIGAGIAGSMLVRHLQRTNNHHLNPVAFVDDDLKKQDLEIANVPVVGAISQLPLIVKFAKIEHIVIAIPSLDKKTMNEIFNICRKTNIHTQIMPSLEDLVEGKTSISQLRDVSIEDLLGRKPVQLEEDNIKETLEKKTILVTGAGGSIGSEICRQLMKYEPDELVLLGHGENSIYLIEMELKEKFTQMNTKISTEIADVQDRTKIFQLIKKYQPTIVYHAAAHKHVPLMERHPEEAVKNNIFGTKNVAEAA